MSYEQQFNVVKFMKSQKGVNGMYKFLQNNKFQYIHAFHQDNMSVCSIPPYTPLFHYLHIFALKHILWVLVRTASMRQFLRVPTIALKHILMVLVRTASMRRFLRVPTIYVLSKNMKMVKKKNQLKIVIFTAVKNRCILHWRVFVM